MTVIPLRQSSISLIMKNNMVSIVDWHVVKSTIICNCYWILLCINCLDWRPRWITPSKICFIIHSKYFQLKKMLYTLINEKLPSSQYYWNDEYINFRYWKSEWRILNAKKIITVGLCIYSFILQFQYIQFICSSFHLYLFWVYYKPI